ncbi:MAG TPA: PilZ domain-containing protein [Vicinamibacterales bacterium]|jgi:hypothetical protein
MDPCAVLIANADVLSALKARAADFGGELLAFTDADALIALEVITKRRPSIVALERDFAETPRGMALINRIKADGSLERVEIRVMSPDDTEVRVLPRAPGAPTPAGSSGGTAAAAVAAPPPALDQRGTRRAPRHRIKGKVEILVDGNVAMLVDLSVIGAQVLSPTILKPNQRVRMALNDDLGNVRFNAAVAWASFEIPPNSGPRYRAGLAFVDADAHAVDAFCIRHRQH